MKVINRFPEIDINWLLNGTGEMYTFGTRFSNPAKQTAPPPEIYKSEIPNNEVARIEPTPSVVHKMPSNPTLFDALEEDAHTTVEPSSEPVKADNALPSGSAQSYRQAINTESPQLTPVEEEQTKTPLISNVNSVLPQAQSMELQNEEKQIVNNPPSKSNIEELSAQHVIENEKTTTESTIEAKNRTQNVKKIVKVIVLYEDHTFSEYYPE